jgi:hypothetical protein
MYVSAHDSVNKRVPFELSDSIPVNNLSIQLADPIKRDTINFAVSMSAHA